MVRHLKSIVHALRSRGINNLVSRARNISGRYGLSKGKMRKNIKKYYDILDRHMVRPTIPITAVVLSRHADLIRAFQKLGVEFSIHGLMHKDMLAMTPEEQKKQINKAIEVFKKQRIQFHGFRAPYLRSNDDIKKILSESGLYDSSDTVIWDVLDPKLIEGSEDVFHRLLDLYENNKPAAMPYLYENCVSIPVSIPDDELLIDRLKIRDQDVIFDVWKKILDLTYRRGEIFVLQLHPERIEMCKEALERLLEDVRSRNPPIAVMTLKEVADWWKNRRDLRVNWPENSRSAFCVTGDVDSVTIWDYVLRVCGR
jgi:peptidoglycan/xylan/chitin deacetylase (PgdA/CDA1 family)